MHLQTDNNLQDLLSHPALPFARHMLPRPEDAWLELPLAALEKLLPWHENVNARAALAPVNRLIDDELAGRRVFYSFYSAHSRKSVTGLFFFRGRPGAPFALVCPGGGFRYVASLHEGFGLAHAISGLGFNAFSLQYRTGGEQAACEDLAMALGWIFDNAGALGVSARGHSLWGASAGARAAIDVGALGALSFGTRDLPAPAAVIRAYSIDNRPRGDDPPTFAVVSRDDRIASAGETLAGIEALRSMGIPADLAIYSRAGHGFGPGFGTDAEGWVELAADFWQKQNI